MKREIVIAIKGILKDNGRVLIIKRSNLDEVGPDSWEIPGGKLIWGEQPEQALLREIKEEVGLQVTIGELVYVSSFMTNPNRQVVIIAYNCQIKDGTVILSSEHSDYKWATEAELFELLPESILADFERGGVLKSLDVYTGNHKS